MLHDSASDQPRKLGTQPLLALHALQVLVATGSSVTLVDADSATDQGVSGGPITRMAVAPNGQFVACFSEGQQPLQIYLLACRGMLASASQTGTANGL